MERFSQGTRHILTLMMIFGLSACNEVPDDFGSGIPKEEDTETQDTVIEDTATNDTGPGTDDTEDTEPVGPPSGLGEPCADNEQACADAEYEADFCVVNPLEPENAYCSTQDCVEGSCEDGYKCCDCIKSLVLPQLAACLIDADAELAGSGMGGCDCETP